MLPYYTLNNDANPPVDEHDGAGYFLGTWIAGLWPDMASR